MEKDTKMIEKLRTAFKDIKYADQRHKYFTTEGEELMSVTKFLSSLKGKFNSDYWTVIKAYQFSGYNVKSIWNNFFDFRLLDEEGNDVRLIHISDNHDHLSVTPEDVKNQWNIDKLVGTTRGSYTHNLLEVLENRFLDIPPTVLPIGLTTAQAVNYVNSIDLVKDLCKEFVEYANENLVMIVAEFAVGDPKLGLAGTFDRLYFNKLTQQYEIWDFKTDKQIRYKSSFGKLQLFDLPDCEFEKYSLQTSIYRKIIEDALNIKLGESRVVWFNLKERSWEIIECKNYVNLLNEKTIENNWPTHIQSAYFN